MKKRRKTALSILLSIAIVALLYLGWSNRASNKERQNRELAYNTALASYARDISVGMTRLSVETYLNSHQVKFSQRSGQGTYDDLIPLARESSPYWYCSWQDVSVAISYDSAGAVIGLKLDHWLRDCL